MLDNTKAKIAKAIGEIEREETMTCRDLEILDKLLHAWKNILKIEEMLAPSKDDLL